MRFTSHEHTSASDASAASAPGSRSPRTRRDRIRRTVVEVGSVRIEELAAELGVTAMTIRRDLDHLQGQGWLRKVRGGATAEPSAVHHGDVRHRRQFMADVKSRLAEAALRQVRPGQSVMLDESTTGLALARQLHRRTPLTVITNFCPVVAELGGTPGIDLVSLGGAYFPAYDAFLGMRTVDGVASLHADLLVASTTAVTRGQCYHQSQETVAVKRALMAACERSVLLVDHTKFARRGLYRLAPLAEFDLVVVDDGIDPADLDAMRSAGVEVQVV